MNFEAEFKTWQAPDDDLDDDTFVFCAAEIFRYLRDMSVDVTSTISPSLLESTTNVSSKSHRTRDRTRDKIFYGAPPITTKLKGGAAGGGVNTTPNLIHPGAIVCMIDLLPSVRFPEDIGSGRSRTMSPDEVFESRSSSRISTLASPPPGIAAKTKEFNLTTPQSDAPSEFSNIPAHRNSASPESDSYYDAELEQNDGNEDSSVLGDSDEVLEPSVVDEVDVEVETAGLAGGEMLDKGELSYTEEAAMDRELAWKVHVCTYIYTVCVKCTVIRYLSRITV